MTPRIGSYCAAQGCVRHRMGDRTVRSGSPSRVFGTARVLHRSVPARTLVRAVGAGGERGTMPGYMR